MLNLIQHPTNKIKPNTAVLGFLFLSIVCGLQCHLVMLKLKQFGIIHHVGNAIQLA